MEERKNFKSQKTEGIHNVIMEGRRKLSISGVSDVESFNEEEVVLSTNMGLLIIEGENLHINKLSTENGEIIIEGMVDLIKYEKERQKESFFSKLFK